jgi:hypothetical protein
MLTAFCQLRQAGFEAILLRSDNEYRLVVEDGGGEGIGVGTGKVVIVGVYHVSLRRDSTH